MSSYNYVKFTDTGEDLCETGDSRPRTVDWKSTDTVLRLGILSLVRHFEPAFESNVPETLTLNVERLRNCQNDFQRIIVMATG